MPTIGKQDGKVALIDRETGETQNLSPFIRVPFVELDNGKWNLRSWRTLSGHKDEEEEETYLATGTKTCS